ncbi:MAG: redox-active disulfide protein 2 [Peptococcaceae bacterium BICA1-7]|nr:MAG: redox-active disulfide protein 2 [Peptococcaceae bacterium BICA1-7]HBV95867.1 thioredoxin family protein [Desulfotomaculum sp.]
MDIKVLGPGCKKCKELESEVKKTLSEIGVEADVEKVEEMNKIMQYSILMTPGLVINGKVKVSGRVPSRKDIAKWIQEEM